MPRPGQPRHFFVGSPLNTATCTSRSRRRQGRLLHQRRTRASSRSRKRHAGAKTWHMSAVLFEKWLGQLNRSKVLRKSLHVTEMTQQHCDRQSRPPRRNALLTMHAPGIFRLEHLHLAIRRPHGCRNAYSRLIARRLCGAATDSNMVIPQPHRQIAKIVSAIRRNRKAN